MVVIFGPIIISGGPPPDMPIPTGTVLAFAGDTGHVPSGYVLCCDQPVSRTTYAALFALLGETYGAGDGSTTFNVPDLRGNVVVGNQVMGGNDAERIPPPLYDATILGNMGGEAEHLLTSQESGVQDHSHQYVDPSTAGSNGAQNGSDFQALGTNFNTNATGDVAYDAINPHNNVQPSIILNYIIKT